jgi:MraZ protein
MFRGNQPTRVDDKGRLKVPSEFKRLLDEQHAAKFFITSKDGERAEIYPIAEWEKIEQGLAKLPSMHPAKRKFLDRTNYYGQEAEFDGQGRLLLPQILREKAKLTGDVAVLGQGNVLVVVNDERLRAEFETDELTEADQEALAALGI